MFLRINALTTYLSSGRKIQMDVKHFCHVVTNVRETIHADIAVNRIAMQVTVEILNYARKRSKLRVRVKNKKKEFSCEANRKGEAVLQCDSKCEQKRLEGKQKKE